MSITSDTFSLSTIYLLKKTLYCDFLVKHLLAESTSSACKFSVNRFSILIAVLKIETIFECKLIVLFSELVQSLQYSKIFFWFFFILVCLGKWWPKHVLTGYNKGGFPLDGLRWLWQHYFSLASGGLLNLKVYAAIWSIKVSIKCC